MNPDKYPGQLKQAIHHFQVANLKEAKRLLSDLVRGQPRMVEALRLLGLTEHRLGNSSVALEWLQKAVAVSPNDALLHNNLGSIERVLGRIDLAEQSFRKACALDPKLAGAWFNLGKLLKSEAQVEQAKEALDQALRINPVHVTALWTRGDTHKSLGNIQAAAADYRNACHLQPDCAEAWWGLANLKTQKFNADEVHRLQQTWTQAISSQSKALLGFALAKGLEDLGKYPEAFETLSSANNLIRTARPWDRAQHSQWVNSIIGAFPRSDAQADCSLPRETNVLFIVGMPRSGSTLLEQMLSAHSQIAGASELPDLPATLAEESARRGNSFPQWVSAMRQEDWKRLGNRYLERTQRWQSSQIFIDKLPDNCWYVGAAAAMLPQAKFIDTRRDRLDTTLSCYQQYWAKGQAFSYELTDIAHYLLDHERIFDHWLQTLPNHCAISNHEKLLDSPQTSLSRLLGFLGLEFEPQCLEYYQSQRAVRTASAAQVRQPIQTDRTHRWRNYEPQLQDILSLLKRQ